MYTSHIGDHEGTNRAHKILFARPMLDQSDDLVRPRPGVFRNCTIATKQVRLFPCAKACARAIPAISDTAKTTISSSPKPKKLRGRASALSSNPWSRRRCGSPEVTTTARLISTTASIDSHLGSFGKGGQYLWKPLYDLAGQSLVVDIAFDRPSAQYCRGGHPLSCIERDPLIPQFRIA